MNITIYQIDPDRDQHGVLYESYVETLRELGTSEVDASIYGKAFEGEVEAENLEEIYEIFNMDPPEGYRGRSMSVSDVIAVRDPESGETAYHYVDAFGFQRITFDESKAAEQYREKIKVILCEPGRMARCVEIGTGLEDLQRVVGGCIETYYPFEEQVCIVCNDEGKINGMRPCRAIRDEEGRIQDIIFGSFFICDCSRESFGSLNAEQLHRYGHLFECPERYYRTADGIKAVPYVPERETRRPTR